MMNTRVVSSLIIVFCLAVGAAWWARRPVPEADQAPVASAPRDVATSAPAVAPSEPEPAPPVAARRAAPVALNTSADPRADLTTAIQDIVRIASQGDYTALVETNIKPDQQGNVNPAIREMMVQQMRNLAQTPAGQQQMRDLVTEMQAIQFVTPVFDATGDHATFNLPPGMAGPPVLFVRVNGLWYRD